MIIALKFFNIEFHLPSEDLLRLGKVTVFDCQSV
nr:MAG TPA: hypothetical protein [Bacteriophage sp.]